VDTLAELCPAGTCRRYLAHVLQQDFAGDVQVGLRSLQHWAACYLLLWAACYTGQHARLCRLLSVTLGRLLHCTAC
jgi:hypothetical protein